MVKLRNVRYALVSLFILLTVAILTILCFGINTNAHSTKQLAGLVAVLLITLALFLVLVLATATRSNTTEEKAFIAINTFFMRFSLMSIPLSLIDSSILTVQSTNGSLCNNLASLSPNCNVAEELLVMAWVRPAAALLVFIITIIVVRIGHPHPEITPFPLHVSDLERGVGQVQTTRAVTSLPHCHSHYIPHSRTRTAAPQGHYIRADRCRPARAHDVTSDREKDVWHEVKL